MMLAYAVSTETPWSPAQHREFLEVFHELGAEHLSAFLPLDGTPECGWRGQCHVADKATALWLVQYMQRVSARFPDATIQLAGAPALPPTQLRAGEFELFSAAYEQALSALAADVTLTLPASRLTH